jgi:hypothetical protein
MEENKFSTPLWDQFFEEGEEKLYTKVLHLLLTNNNFQQRPSDGRIEIIHERRGISPLTPWIHFRHGTIRHCGHYNQLFCKSFEHIPRFCRWNCWKTVIKPRNFKYLYELYAIMRAMDLPSKCGVDQRDYTPGPYAGFIYGDSLEEGRRYWKLMSETLVEAGFSVTNEAKEFEENHDMNYMVFLKRGCTEMEELKASDQWDQMTPEEMRMEQKFKDLFVFDAGEGNPHPASLNAVKRLWVRHAMSIGDISYKEVVYDVQDLHPHVVHYETPEAFEKTRSEVPADTPKRDGKGRFTSAK